MAWGCPLVGDHLVVRFLPIVGSCVRCGGVLFAQKKKGEGGEEALTKLNRFVTDHYRQLPTLQLYSVFSQLISRITHPTESVFLVLAVA